MCCRETEVWDVGAMEEERASRKAQYYNPLHEIGMMLWII